MTENKNKPALQRPYGSSEVSYPSTGIGGVGYGAAATGIEIGRGLVGLPEREQG